MTKHRFFISPDNFQNTHIELPEDVSHQITQVLRLKQTDQIIILDNTGHEYVCVLLKIDKRHSVAKVIKKQLNHNEPEIKVHLYQSIINRDNFELVLQKAVELGVAEITPIQTERSQFGVGWAEDKSERFQKIIKEAAEQSERGNLPILNNPLNYESAILNATETENTETIIGWEKEQKKQLDQILKSNKKAFNVFIGPEGGFTELEIEFCEAKKVKTVSLGKRILRSETATIALISKILIS